MPPVRLLLARIVSVLRRRQLDRDLDEEGRAHLTLLAAEYERRGMTPMNARTAARRDFGGVEQMKEVSDSRLRNE
jgi:hypothetical protein